MSSEISKYIYELSYTKGNATTDKPFTGTIPVLIFLSHMIQWYIESYNVLNIKIQTQYNFMLSIYCTIRIDPQEVYDKYLIDCNSIIMAANNVDYALIV